VGPDALEITNEEQKQLRSFLESTNTRAFLLLKDGKIVLEEYFGKDLLTGQNFNKDSYWYWASAGKTLTAFTVGLAQEQGFLDLNQKTSDFLGVGWTAMPKEKEDLVTVKHQLTMTSGMDLELPDPFCFEPQCLQYKADAGTRWDYHNGPYTLLDNVIANATKQNFDTYFNQNLRDKIGMDGFWRYVNNNHVYFSTARSMARFGILMMNNGDWDGEEIMTDKSYFNSMINTSQNLNEAYGYLWWLNGKDTGMVPGVQIVFKRWITPNAPKDMFAAMGKNGQQLNIVPSRNLIVVRMGDSPDASQTGIQFQDDMWAELNKILD
jgi:CubicO group peptidase (beta-lactamase class C family)